MSSSHITLIKHGGTLRTTEKDLTVIQMFESLRERSELTQVFDNFIYI